MKFETFATAGRREPAGLSVRWQYLQGTPLGLVIANKDWYLRGQTSLVIGSTHVGHKGSLPRNPHSDTPNGPKNTIDPSRVPDVNLAHEGRRGIVKFCGKKSALQLADGQIHR